MGAQWTEKGIDFEWMLARLADFNDAQHGGKQGKENKEVKAFILRVYDDYQLAFPKRMDSWSLAGLGTGGSIEERRAKCIDRISNWFVHKNKQVGVTGNKGKKTKMENFTSAKGSRGESYVNGYYRLFNAEHNLDTAIEDDYKDHVAKKMAIKEKPLPPGSRRNQYLSERFKALPQETQDFVNANLLPPGAKEPGIKLHALDELKSAITEKDRRSAALAVQENIDVMLASMERLADASFARTGWNFAVFAAGPEPRRGGNINVYCTTRGNLGSLSFEDFTPCWNDFKDSFANFAERVFSEEVRLKFTLANISENHHTCDDPTPRPSQTPSPSPAQQTTPSADIVEESNKPEESAQFEMENIDPTIWPDANSESRLLETNIGTQPPEADNELNSNKEGNEAVGNGAIVTTIENIPDNPQPSFPDNSQPPTSALKKPLSVVTSAPPSTTNHSTSQKAISARSTRANARAAIGDGEGGETEAEKRIWTYDASKYLQETFSDYKGEELVNLWRKFEAALGNPTNKTKANKIDTSNAPDALKHWAAKSARNIMEPPKDLAPSHLQQTIAWYQSLQPSPRNHTWPPPQLDSDHSLKWDALMKGSPHGLFLVLMCISWIPDSTSSDQSSVMSSLANDLLWVLQIFVKGNLKPAGPTKRKSDATNTAKAKRAKN